MTLIDPQPVTLDRVLPSAQELLDEESRLHARVVSGDELALMECFDRTGPLVFCAALLHTGLESEAEALTEALFVEFWQSPNDFAPERGPLGLQMLLRLSERAAAA